MHELASCTPGRCAVEAILDEIFDCLDVVIGFALQLFDRSRIGFSKCRCQHFQYGEGLGGHSAQFGNARLGGQGFEPQRFDPYPLAHQTPFAEQRPQFSTFVGITAVNGGDGIQCMCHLEHPRSVPSQR